MKSRAVLTTTESGACGLGGRGAAFGAPVARPFFVCLPCQEGHHRGCMRLPCECECREKKGQGNA